MKIDKYDGILQLNYKVMSKKNKKIQGNIVYSTDDNFHYDFELNEEPETLPAEKQQLKVFIDNKKRSGKKVTVIGGFIGKTVDLEALGKNIKTKCATGGTVKDGEIIIQGDLRDKILQILLKSGYKAKISGYSG
jgi:translation initiation factor 1